MAKKELIINSDLKLEHKVMGLLICIAQEQSMKINRSIRPFNLSYTQVNILDALSDVRNGQLTVNQIKGVMVDENPNVSRAINKLAAKKYVIKERSHEDQRVVYITITDRGREILEAAINELYKISLHLPHGALRKLYDLLITLN